MLPNVDGFVAVSISGGSKLTDQEEQWRAAATAFGS